MNQLPPFQSVPNHPYVTYRTYTDQYGRFWIECRCNHCGPRGAWRKQCQRPAMAGRWVFQYASEHGHGLSPRRAR